MRILLSQILTVKTLFKYKCWNNTIKEYVGKRNQVDYYKKMITSSGLKYTGYKNLRTNYTDVMTDFVVFQKTLDFKTRNNRQFSTMERQGRSRCCVYSQCEQSWRREAEREQAYTNLPFLKSSSYRRHPWDGFPPTWVCETSSLSFGVPTVRVHCFHQGTLTLLLPYVQRYDMASFITTPKYEDRPDIHTWC